MKETPYEYARRRATETGCTYLITSMGHVLWADPPNRRLAERDLGGIAVLVRP
jgi:hypothetical protein